MALAKCEDCGHDVSTTAAACPNCGKPTNAALEPTPASASAPAQTGFVTSPPTASKRSWFRRHPILTVILALIVVGAISSAASKGNSSGSSGVSANNASAAASTPIAQPASTSTPPASRMTVAQQQAVESATSYLSMGGFSRAGLIQQLSSSAGEGFPNAVAVFAVDHLHVNWNEQAVESAKSYLKMGGFSRAELIQQLSSSAGEGFTYGQAVYAANQVGL
jgi:Host cell surface-exposed lipoprotein